MIRLLPFILIPILIISGLGVWRYVAARQSPVTPQLSQQTVDSIPISSPMEVPKSLPAATSAPTPPIGTPIVLDARVGALEATITDLKARILSLEKATPNTQTVGAKLATVYIPLGTGGTSGDKNWIENSNYGATIDPAEYPGYSSMQLEVNFRMTQKSGTAYARLYNMTDSSAKEQVSTTSDSFSWQTSYSFTLPAGKKIYTLQTKSSEGAEIQLQSARIKVNF